MVTSGHRIGHHCPSTGYSVTSPMKCEVYEMRSEATPTYAAACAECAVFAPKGTRVTAVLYSSHEQRCL
jgi:hypothetical protein